MESFTKCSHHEACGIGIAKPATAPGPVTFHRVDKQGNEEGVDAVHREFGTLSHGTRNDGCTRSAEYGLKY